MITKSIQCRAVLLVAAMTIAAAGTAFAQYEWGDIVNNSVPLQTESWGAIGYGDVAEGFSSFAIDIDSPGPISLEIIVTEERRGAAHTDDDSMLWLFNNESVLVAENDDGPFGSYASLINGYDVEEPGRYYAVVTTHPNSPELDFDNRFLSLGDDGNSNISFELIVESGYRDDPGVYADPFEESETVVFFEDFDGLSEPVEYRADEELLLSGSVSDTVAIYRITVDEFVDLSAEVYEASGDYGDTQLFLIDGLGFLIAEDDDSGFEGGSLIFRASLSPATHYYLAVTTFPNGPNIDEFGFVEGFAANGSSTVDFELMLGPPQEYASDDYDDYSGFGGETAIWFDEFPSFAETLYYLPGDVVELSGYVEGGVALFRLETDNDVVVSVRSVANDEGYGDTVLFVIDSEGFVVAEDDDGAGYGGSLLNDVYLDGQTHYYIAVAPYPNWPNTDEFGYVEGFPAGGDGPVSFDLDIGPSGSLDAVEEVIGESHGPVDDVGFAVYGMDELAEWSSPIRLTNGRGVGYGEVGTGFYSFSIRIDEPLYLTAEVVVTEELQGTSYTDSDSMLAIFASDGELIASDDDGGEGGASKLVSVWLQDAGTYYAVVTTYPNEPNTNFGVFQSIEPFGESRIRFDLVVSTDYAAQ